MFTNVTSLTLSPAKHNAWSRIAPHKPLRIGEKQVEKVMNSPKIIRKNENLFLVQGLEGTIYQQIVMGRTYFNGLIKLKRRF